MIRHRQTGFTLIEVLIAMWLLTIMMVLLFTSLRISVRNWDAGEQRISDVSKAAATHNFFRRHLTTIYPLKDDFSDEQSVFAFQGDVATITFVSALPASVGRMGLQLFTVKLERDDQEGKEIKVAIEPFFPSADGLNWRGDVVVLIDQVETLEFSYFGKQDRNQDNQWYDQWQDQSKLPELIKIAISLEGDVVWPEIVIAPRINRHLNTTTSPSTNTNPSTNTGPEGNDQDS